MIELRIGFLPFYVDYYEGICADMPADKAAVAQRCADRLRAQGDVVWDGELIRNETDAAAAGRQLAGKKLTASSWSQLWRSSAAFPGRR